MKFIKVTTYDKVYDTWIDSYINPEKIQQLVVIPKENDDVKYLVKFEDMAIRVSHQSYKKLINILYGEEYDTNTKSEN